MNLYHKILVALELNPDCDEIILEKAKELSAQENASIYLIHAVEHLSNYGAAYGISAGVDIEEMLLKEANESMKDVGNHLNIPGNRQIVKVGPAKIIILEEAEKVGIDLIVVGSHGRHGVRLLLGSTANAVLHGSQCDVLAVRVR